MRSFLGTTRLNLLGWGLAAVLLAGCGGADTLQQGASVTERLPMVRIPVLLQGPLSVLLTNAQGFSARATLENFPSSDKHREISGELLARGGKLLFARATGDGAAKRAGGFMFIWDVAAQNGYLLSEAMQAYAPLGSAVQFTNVVSEPVPGPSGAETIEGYRCARSRVTVQSTEGLTATFQVWRAAELGGLPVRIVAMDQPAVTLRLSKVRLEAPPAHLFQPPDDFTRFENPDLMISELVVRQAMGKKKHRPDWQPDDDFGAQDPPMRHGVR